MGTDGTVSCQIQRYPSGRSVSADLETVRLATIEPDSFRFAGDNWLVVLIYAFAERGA